MIVSRHLRWLWLTLAVALLDRASKAWIESRPAFFFPHIVIPGYLNIISSRNPGIAFSFLADPSSPTLRYLLVGGSLVIIGVIAWLLVSSRSLHVPTVAGLALLLAGATGNATDRIVHGAVTDFVQVWLKFLPWSLFNPWPTFNVADAAVTVGAILIVFDVIFLQRHSAKL